MRQVIARFGPRVRARSAVGTLVFALAACASAPDVLTEGRRLIAEGRIDEGLATLEAAARAQPRRVEAYNLYVTQRDAIVNAYVREGDALRSAADLDGAEARYRSALAIDARSVTAQTGLDAVARARRLGTKAEEARSALQSGDAANADRLARAVLAEDSSQRVARAVMRAVAEQRMKAQTSAPKLQAALGRTISLELREAPLSSVFEIVSRMGGINFVLDREVKGEQKVAVFVHDSSLDDVIKIVLLTNQLERKVLNENSILIYPATQTKQREYQELVMRSFYLANADVKQTAAMIRALVKTRDIFIDEKLNLLVMRDTAEAVQLAEQLVATQDLGEPEVMLELEVLEVASSAVEEFGIRYPEQIVVGVPGTGTNSSEPTFPALAPIGSGSRLKAYVANPVFLLNLRKLDGSTNVLANPRIRVKNREKASVHIGERVPVITTTSTANVGVSSSVNYLETGLKLDVEPNVHLEDEVAIKLQLEVSNILEQLNVAGTVSYRLGTRNAATTLRLRDGETQVIAGLISTEDRKSVAKVPHAAELPVLGPLFRNNDERASKSEIVLLITPHVVRNLARPDTVAAQFPSGTEAAPGSQPLRLAPAAAFSLAPGVAVRTAAPAPPAAADAPPIEPLDLSINGPAQVALGQEFAISLSLPATNDGGSATVELRYDNTVLNVVDAGRAGRAGEAGRDAGAIRVDVAAPNVVGMPPSAQQVRFRVVAKSPTKAQIVVDASGSRHSVHAPGGLTVDIVAP